ncbi:MAG TPA: GntR family transcriptional regulator [Hyphomicrobiaceae bacterium]|nr:GntR family transcriptional regulator [Hyphomicrobiaceae bacterium]
MERKDDRVRVKSGLDGGAVAALQPAPPGDARDLGVTAHESVYRRLRERILFGGFLPGGAITLRGLAEALGVSPMPVREAVRRLIAERALAMQDNRRVLVPPMTRAKFEQVLFARRALEPELAARALLRMSRADIEAIAAIDQTIDQTIINGDVDGYTRGNFRFHFTIYGYAEAETLLGLLESIWLQFGPFMRMAYGRIGTSKLEDYHQAAIEAMRRGDEAALRAAIIADIGQGMGFIGDAVLGRVQ